MATELTPDQDEDMALTITRDEAGVRQWTATPVRANELTPPEVLRCRRAVCDALHDMHRDQQIIIDAGRAETLLEAWQAYDAALLGHVRRDYAASLERAMNAGDVA